MARAIACPWWAPNTRVRRMSRSSVPCRCAAYSLSARFRIDIRPEYPYARVECQQDGTPMTNRTDDDFAREIEAHLAIETDRLIAEGLDPDAARARARRAFGNVTRARERFYERRRIGWLEDLRRDLRSASRNVRRNPVSALVIVLSLAGGIGAATMALVVRNVIFYNPPPLYRAPAELAKVQAAPRDRPILPAGADPPPALVARWREALGDRLAPSIGGRAAGMERAAGVSPG